MNIKSTMLVVATVAVLIMAIVSIPAEESEADVSDESQLRQAIESATGQTTIKLADSVSTITLTTPLIIDSGQEITLDLNGKTISYNGSDRMISNSGNLTITGNGTLKAGGSSNGPINNLEGAKLHIIDGDYIGTTNNKSATIRNVGNLEIDDANISGGAVAIRTNPNATTNINGGTYSNVTTGLACLDNFGTLNIGNEPEATTTIIVNGVGTAISSDSGSTTNIYRGTFSNTGSDYVCISNNGTMNIYNGVFKNVTTTNTVINNGTMWILGGTFKAESNCELLNNAGTIEISGGEFSNVNNVLENRGIMTISGNASIHTDTHMAISNKINSTLNINGGIISSGNCSACDGFVDYTVDSYGTLNITGGDITGTQDAVGIYGGTVTISGGNIRTVPCDNPNKQHVDSGAYYPLYLKANNPITVNISEGIFTSSDKSAIYVNGNVSTASINLSITGGTFEISDKNSDADAITIAESGDSSISMNVEIKGGTFKAPIPDNTVPTGYLEGTDDEGNVVIGEAVTITIYINEVEDTVKIASGSCIPADKITEEVGYTYAYDGYDSRDKVLSIEFTEDSRIDITKTLDAPTDVKIEYSRSSDLPYGGSLQMTATAIIAAEGANPEYQWYRDNVVIAGANSQTYKADESGTYTVQVRAVVSDSQTFESEYTQSSNSVKVTIAEQKFKVTFISDGNTVYTEEVASGDSVASWPQAPTKTGYEFAGWFNGDSEFTTETTVTSDLNVTASWTLEAPIEVNVELSGPLYEGGTITATVIAQHILSDVTYMFAMGLSDSQDEPEFVTTNVFTIDTPGEYVFAVYAVNGADTSGYNGKVITIGYAEPEPIPGDDDSPVIPSIDDDDDYIPLPPHIVQGDTSSDNETVKVVACAAAAVVAALIATFLIISYRKD